MPQTVYSKVITGEDPKLLCDALCRLSGLSKVKTKDAMAKGAVWVRRQGSRKRRIRRIKSPVRPGETIWLYHDPEILARHAPEALCIEDRRRYSIWYKPAGLMSQGSPFGDHCALPRQIEKQFSPRRSVHLVHRLDWETAGLMVVAHEKNAAARLSEMLRKNRIEKRYHVRVRGDLRTYAQKGAIDLPLDDRSASTTYDVTSYDAPLDTSTAIVRLQTGRRHQIRRHFDMIGYPVMGDPRYGRNNSDPEGLQLTAFSIAFHCPFGGGRIESAIDPVRRIGDGVGGALKNKVS